MKKPCGIYEILNEKGRPSYKIFADEEDLRSYLAKNKGKNAQKGVLSLVLKTLPTTQAQRLENYHQLRWKLIC